MGKYDSNSFQAEIVQWVDNLPLHKLHYNVPQATPVGKEAVHTGDVNNVMVYELIGCALILRFLLRDTDAKFDSETICQPDDLLPYFCSSMNWPSGGSVQYLIISSSGESW